MIIWRGFGITPGVCEEVKTMWMQCGLDANEDEGEVKKPRKSVPDGVVNGRSGLQAVD
jgi:hypothetical protein